jgi:predicted nucleic acid-binding Zn ribbon protein
MTYRFRCQKCNRIIFVDHAINDPHPQRCFAVDEDKVCGGKLIRLFDAPAVTYHGSGFYSTDKALYEPSDL